MKQFKKLSLVLVLVLCGILLLSCAKSDQKPDVTGEGENQDQNRVGMILSGPITDVSWNGPQYSGLLEIEKLGAEIAYQENIDVSQVVDALRTYCDEGFDVVFLSTNFYEEAALPVTAEYPDITFFIINGTTTKDNVYSFQLADEQQGFMMGAIAALVSTDEKVAFVGGNEITPILNARQGFEQGVAYVSKEITALTAMTGSSTDVIANKSTAQALIDQGADVIAPVCDNAGLGVVEAAQESGVYAVASGKGQEGVAPDAVLITVEKDGGIAVKAAYEAYLSGKLEGETLLLGAAEGVVEMSDWFESADSIPKEVKDAVQQVYQDMCDGKIDIERFD